MHAKTCSCFDSSRQTIDARIFPTVHEEKKTSWTPPESCGGTSVSRHRWESLGKIVKDGPRVQSVALR